MQYTDIYGKINVKDHHKLTFIRESWIRILCAESSLKKKGNPLCRGEGC